MQVLEFEEVVDVIQRFCQQIPVYCSIEFSVDLEFNHAMLECSKSYNASKISLDVCKDKNSNWLFDHTIVAGDVVKALHAKLKAVFEVLFQPLELRVGMFYNDAVFKTRTSFNDLLKNIYMYERCTIKIKPNTDNNTIQLTASSPVGIRENIVINIRCVPPNYEISGMSCSLSEIDSTILNELKYFQWDIYGVMKALHNEDASSNWIISLDKHNDRLYVTNKHTSFDVFSILFRNIGSLLPGAVRTVIINGERKIYNNYLELRAILLDAKIITDSRSHGRSALRGVYPQQSIMTSDTSMQSSAQLWGAIHRLSVLLENKL